MTRMLKKFVKSIFPESLVKSSYNRFLAFKLKWLDPLVFPEFELKDSQFHLKKDEYPFRLTRVKKDHLDPRLKKQYDENDTWTQDEYLLVLEEPCLIEPDQGWALIQKKKLVYPSLGFGRAPYVPKPSLAKVKEGIPLLNFGEIISLRDTGEKNYFHFYNDVIPKLFLLRDKLNLSDEIPVLISRSLFDSAYFQYFYQRSFLQHLHWVIQDDNFIQSQKTYFCKPLTHTKEYFDRFLEIAPDFTSAPLQNDKIFITRSRKSSRFIENKEEVEELCRSFGFEVVDFENMPLEEQMKTFARARYAIGVHGAGLTNMIYRRGKPLSILEIFPPGDYFPFHYILLATQYQYHYDGIIGEKSPVKFSAGFNLDLGALRDKLNAFLQH